MTATSEAPRAGRLGRGICLIGIALGLALRLSLPFLLPFGEEVRHRLQGLNDEPAHFRYVEYVASHHALPVQTHRFEEAGAFTRADFEFHQPPLFYVLSAGLHGMAGPRHALLACRLLCALCGIATVWIAWRVLQSSALSRDVTWAATMFASLWLTPAYFCAVVSNDALSWLLASALVWMLWRRPSGRPSARRAAALGMVLGLGLLAKTTLAVFLPVVGIAGVWESLRSRRAAPLVECGAAALMGCLIAVPWYLRNLSVYGSVWGFEMGGDALPYTGAHSTWAALLAGTNKYFWFPMQHVPVTSASRLLRTVGLVLLAIYSLAAIQYFWRRRGEDARETYLVITLALVALAYGIRNLLWFAPEARFLLPAFVPILFCLAAGSQALKPSTRWPSFASWQMLALSLLPFAYLALV